MSKSTKITISLTAVALIAVLGWKFVAEKRVEKNDIIKIGVLAPLTGDFAVLGERIRNGMELAKIDLVSKNIVRQDEVKVVYMDACKPEETLSATQKLLNIDKVSMIGGSFCLIGLPSILPMAKEKNIVIFNTAANPDFVLNQDDIFSTNFSIKNDAEKMARYARENLRAKTAAIVYLQTPFGDDYKKYLTEYFEKTGGKVLISEGKLLDAADFRTEITKIKVKNPDVIFVVHLASPLGNFLKQTKELNVQAHLIGHYEAEDPTIIKIAGDAAEGFIISSSEPSPSDTVLRFKEEYKNKFGEEPDVLASNAYDSFMLEITLYKKCSGDIRCLKSELHNVKDYQGVSGVITINPDGSSNKPTIFKIVKDGKFQNLAI